MPDHQPATHIRGAITDIFTHRFVVDTGSARILADVGPKGAAKAALRLGESLELIGDMKPSELKVRRIVRGSETIDIDINHDGKTQDHEAGDPAAALDAVGATGLMVMGQPRRKPKHFEILARDHSGGLSEIHVELDGTIRKSKPVERSDGKWADAIRAAETAA